MSFLLLRVYDSQQLTQWTGALKIPKTQHWPKQVQTSETFGVFVISFEASLIDNRWQYNSKRGSFGKLRVRSIWLWIFTCDINCQHVQQLVKSWEHNTNSNKVKHQITFVFLLFPSKFYLSIILHKIIARGTVLKILKYDK